jgi:hypothetical protein
MKALFSIDRKTSRLIAEKHFHLTNVESIWLDEDGEEVFIVGYLHQVRGMAFTDVYVGDRYELHPDCGDIIKCLTRHGAKLIEITT